MRANYSASGCSASVCKFIPKSTTFIPFSFNGRKIADFADYRLSKKTFNLISYNLKPPNLFSGAKKILSLRRYENNFAFFVKKI